MLKFQKNTVFGFRYNHISEFIGSHVYDMLGINCQETFLGIYNGLFADQSKFKKLINNSIKFIINVL